MTHAMAEGPHPVTGEPGWKFLTTPLVTLMARVVVEPPWDGMVWTGANVSLDVSPNAVEARVAALESSRGAVYYKVVLASNQFSIYAVTPTVTNLLDQIHLHAFRREPTGLPRDSPVRKWLGESGEGVPDSVWCSTARPWGGLDGLDPEEVAQRLDSAVALTRQALWSLLGRRLEPHELDPQQDGDEK